MTSSPLTAEQRELYEEVIAFWTPERMASAKPIGSAVPALAEPRPAAPGAFTTTKVDDPADKPHYRRAGRLFVDFNGKTGSGSACAIARNGILTAAHCLYDFNTKQYATKVLYVPGYQNKGGKLGSWALFGTPSIPDGYIKATTKNYSWDYAFSKVSLGGLNNLSVLGDVTGWFGLVVDRSTASQWDTLGYPTVPFGAYKFDGEFMWSCVGDFKGKLDPGTITKEGNLTQGSSGGPWMINADYVNGVQSHTGATPTENASPYFDKDVLDLYNKTFGH